MKKQILIIGKVHDIGYRVFLLGLAQTIELERFYADNIFIDDKQAVNVLIESSEDKVNSFIDIIKREKPRDAVVDKIDVKDYDGSIMKIEVYSRYFTSMQLNKMVIYGREMLSKQDKIIDVIKDESEKTRNLIKEESEKTRDVIKEEADKTRIELGGKIDLLRTDLKSYIEYNLKNIRDEISEIKQVLKNAGLI